MTFDIREWTKYVRKQRRFSAENSFYGCSQITHTVSKTFKGRAKQDRTLTRCEKPEISTHLHFPGGFDCKSLESNKCDSKYSRDHIFGSMRSGYQATFGHDEPTSDQNGLFKERGYFFGGLQLLHPKTENVLLKGAIDGTCNTGVVHDPLQNNCEKCHQVGRWHGRLHAAVKLPNNERAFLVASIAVDVAYDSHPSYLATEFVGTLEGMLIRACKKAG